MAKKAMSVGNQSQRVPLSTRSSRRILGPSAPLLPQYNPESQQTSNGPRYATYYRRTRFPFLLDCHGESLDSHSTTARSDDQLCVEEVAGHHGERGELPHNFAAQHLHSVRIVHPGVEQK